MLATHAVELSFGGASEIGATKREDGFRRASKGLKLVTRGTPTKLVLLVAVPAGVVTLILPVLMLRGHRRCHLQGRIQSEIGRTAGRSRYRRDADFSGRGACENGRFDLRG